MRLREMYFKLNLTFIKYYIIPIILSVKLKIKFKT